MDSHSTSNCAPHDQMEAILSDAAAAPVGAAEILRYVPPSGSTLIGGTLQVGIAADGYGTGATGAVLLYEPAYSDTDSNVFFRCGVLYARCHANTNVYIGQLSLPAGRGGALYLEASCRGGSADKCSAGGSYSAWATVGVPWAHLLLSSSTSPEGVDFSGSALQPNARGTAHLVFTASDPGGPGVYRVTTFVDGQPVWDGTPNTNSGACVPVGNDVATGALMFDVPQPCLATEVVDVPVPTAGLPDGGHELAVAVTDAARNTSTVLDQQITTSNPQRTPVPGSRRSVRAELVISWSWNGAITRLNSIKVTNLPRGGRIDVRCTGRGCPRLRPRSGSGRSLSRLLRTLGGRRFRAGARFWITLSAPHRRPERIALAIRNGRIPLARLLGS